MSRGAYRINLAEKMREVTKIFMKDPKAEGLDSIGDDGLPIPGRRYLLG